MPERGQALMRTRCPECGTVFRVTSEQLRFKAGKVRCGHCQAVFNAFDSLQPEPEEAPAAGSVPANNEVETGFAADFPREEQTDPVQESTAPSVTPGAEPEVALAFEISDELPVAAVPGFEAAQEVNSEIAVAPIGITLPATPPDAGIAVTAEDLPSAIPPDVRRAAPEDSAQAAREAGLVAARDLSETPAYNRWAAGTLAGSPLGGFGVDQTKRVVWPFVVVAVLLFIVLLGQLLYHFRTEVVKRFPGLADIYALAAVDVPLPRNSGLVSIETSDLQSDNARGLYVLQATLKNRATYAQAWPALELSLTDTSDAVLIRRVIPVTDYLPPGTQSDIFPANAEVAVRLWVEAKNVGAAGYRLYIFYP